MSVVSTFGCHSLAARQHNNRGMALANEGRYEDAIAEFTEAIELDPAYALGYNNRGWAYSEKGQYDLAIADLSKAIELNPELAVAYSNRGSAYNNKGQLELAIADLNNAIKLDPELVAAYNNRGLVYSSKGQWEPAIADFTKAIELDPNYAVAYSNRGLTYGNKGEWELAIADFTKAIELDPSYAVAYNNRGWVYNEKGQYDLAIADLGKAIELDADYTLAYNNRGWAYSEKGQNDLAIGDFNKVLELSTDPILIQLAQLRIAELEPTAMPVEPSPAGALVEIIIYTDFQCSACAELHLEVEQELLRLYVDTGKASLQMRLLSTLGPESSLAAQAALCAADQGQFWEYRDAILTSWRQDGRAAYSEENLRKAAAELGLDGETFSACLAGGSKRAEVVENLRQSAAADVSQIPTVFINGH